MRLRSAEFWRARALEAQTVAESMRSVDSRRTMLEIAAQYEVLARSTESLAKTFPDITWRDDKSG
jgi:hypothetical protein